MSGNEWMYNDSGKVDTEQYLLGKRIDAAVDPLKEPDISNDWISNIPEPGDITSRAKMWKTKDAFAKAREDPMFIIEKQKLDAKVDLRNNPLKMQRIKDLLSAELKKDLKKKKKKSKNKEEELPTSSRVKEPRSDRDQKDRKHHRSYDRSHNRSPESARSHRSRSPKQSRDRHHKSYDRLDAKRRRSTSPVHPKSPPKLHDKPYTKSRPRRGSSGLSKKLTKEELEQKRLEMMESASVRDAERKNKYSQRKQAQESDILQNKEGKADFVHQFKVDSYSSSKCTVEGAIKSNIFSKQRTKADMNKFLKK